MIDPAFFNTLDAMALQLKRKAFGKYQGEQHTVYAGDGLTFKDYSPYTVGDDFRRIDWRIYARTKELFIKRYESDRNLLIHILVDSSASMGYGKKDSKYSYAATLAMGVAHIAQKQNERVQVALFDTDFHMFKSASQHRTIQNLVRRMNEVKCKGKTNFEYVLTKYKEQVRSKALLFVFSDFMYPSDNMKRILDYYANSQVFLVQVLHEDEVNLPMKGEIQFKDPEEPKQVVKTYVSTRMRSIYKDALHEHAKMIREACKGNKSDFVMFTTSQKPIHSFIELWNRVN